eukprot:COSAG02_NODE_72_length_41961_cov_13.243658_8_plen_424_part_00
MPPALQARRLHQSCAVPRFHEIFLITHPRKHHVIAAITQIDEGSPSSETRTYTKNSTKLPIAISQSVNRISPRGHNTPNSRCQCAEHSSGSRWSQRRDCDCIRLDLPQSVLENRTILWHSARPSGAGCWLHLPVSSPYSVHCKKPRRNGKAPLILLTGRIFQNVTHTIDWGKNGWVTAVVGGGRCGGGCCGWVWPWWGWAGWALRACRARRVTWRTLVSTARECCLPAESRLSAPSSPSLPRVALPCRASALSFRCLLLFALSSLSPAAEVPRGRPFESPVHTLSPSAPLVRTARECCLPAVSLPRRLASPCSSPLSCLCLVLSLRRALPLAVRSLVLVALLQRCHVAAHSGPPFLPLCTCSRRRSSLRNSASACRRALFSPIRCLCLRSRCARIGSWLTVVDCDVSIQQVPWGVWCGRQLRV